MAKGWYVVHTYSGYENKVQKHLTKMMEDGLFGEAVSDVKVPSEDVVEIRDGKKKITTKKFLPGYILVEMDLADEGAQRFEPRFAAGGDEGDDVELDVAGTTLPPSE